MMPPDDHDRYPDDPLPVGAWGVSPEPEPVPAPDHDPDAVPVVYPVRVLWCRRCGEHAEPVAGRCPWCGNWTDGDPPRPKPRPRSDDEWADRDPPRPKHRPGYGDEDDWHAGPAPYAIPVRRPYLIPPLVIVAVAYFGLLGSLVACALVAALQGATTGDEVRTAQVLTEVVTTGLTLVALALVWRAARQTVPEGTAALTWVSAVPVLGALLLMNLAFFTVLRELLKPFGAVEPERMKLTLATVLLICVQPAIVEELFFRQMTLGVLRRSVNVHLAVWITGAVFAGAHLGNILGMPYLFLVGAFLGYARVYGGLTLAMVLHFLHNLAVVAYDALRP